MSATRTQTERKRLDPGGIAPFQKEYQKRIWEQFRDIKGAVRKTVDRNDALRLSRNQQPRSRFDEPVQDNFMAWFDRVVNELDPSEYDQFIEQAYRRGLIHADLELQRAGMMSESVLPEMAGGATALTAVGLIINRPRHRDSVDRFKSRNRRALRKIMQDVISDVDRELLNEVSSGSTKRQVANSLNETIDEVGITRGRTTALHETSFAASEAILERFEENGVDEVELKAEYRSAADSQVCPICEPFHRDTMSVDEARGMIPQHPGCRCIWVLKAET